jgi:hypothetical protein
MNQTIAIERVDHIGIRVRNLDRALNFYGLLGFNLLRRADTATTSPLSAMKTALSSIWCSTPMPATRALMC